MPLRQARSGARIPEDGAEACLSAAPVATTSSWNQLVTQTKKAARAQRSTARKGPGDAVNREAGCDLI